ncbi:hypothetical protein [Nonomuraea sp. SYSU D8015]|uniref:hypothetical protein n=1 Tax=Nonomuraea sp. SYSU D8015 TaxID=2593644 RepID=UPI0016601B0B|nr:hypothetical protein [Nonomuraea sp. SYSU D8015]
MSDTVLDVPPFDRSPRIVDEKLPKTIYLLVGSNRDRPYTTKGHLTQRLNAMSDAELERTKVYATWTGIHYGLSGWVDVTDRFILPQDASTKEGEDA